MRLSDTLVEFLNGPLMILLGTRSAAFVPEIGRAIGQRLSPEASALDLIVSRWQWPATVDNIAATGALAVTLARPDDYVTYQFKGSAKLLTARAEDVALAERHMRRMFDCLCGLGVEPAAAASWFCGREPVVARLQIAAVFVQTPGAQAGTPVLAGS